MWVSPAVLLLCLGLVTSAPTVADRPADNALAEEASQMGDLSSDLESVLGFNSTSDEWADYEMLSALFEDNLEDVTNRTDSLGSDSLPSDGPFEDRAVLQESTAPEANSSSEKRTASVKTPTTKTPTTTSEQSSAAGDSSSTNENHPSTAETPSSSSSSSSDSAEDEYSYEDYYDYAASYADFVEPTVFPFAMFKDTDPRGPEKGEVLPSSCAWAVVQCCENPDKTGSRVSCFSHVGCYGSWFQDFCTPELKKIVFKSVFQSFKLNP